MALSSSNSSTGAGSASKGGQSSKGSSSTGPSSKGSSSKGSSSTGSQPSSKTSAGSTTSGSNATTSNSTGNFSGGRLPGLGGQSFSSWSGSSSETDAAHASGVQGPGLANGNFGSAWSGNGNHGSGSGSYTYNNTSYSNNKAEPVMTVDEVYGKIETATGTSGNQPTVEKQGDYAASSNEKSEVKTSTPGKQEDITVTPVSVTEDKGLVDNSAIESIEGLNFQQKDKESQDVMEAKKNRDETEAEDKANQMRDTLKAAVEGGETEEGANDFQIGDRDEDVANAKAEADRLANEKTKLEGEQKDNATELESINGEASKIEQAINQEDADYQAKLKNNKQLDAIGQKIQDFEQRYQEIANKNLNIINGPKMVLALDKLKSEVNSFCEQLGVEAPNMSHDVVNAKDAPDAFQDWVEGFAREHFDGLKDFSPDSINAYKAGIDQKHLQLTQEYSEKLDAMAKKAKVLEKRQNELKGLIAEAEKKSGEAQTAYDNLVNGTFTEEVTTGTPKEEAPVETPTSGTKQAFDNAIQDAVEKGADEQTVQAMTDIATSIDEAQTEMKEAIAANNIPAYIEAQKKYNENLDKALEIGNGLTQTDYNKPFVEAVAGANDFDVTLADGTKAKYSEFATNMATKSPEVAKAMYSAKADRLETEGHPILAKIERAKAAMVGTWLGSKLTQADNQVRNQFNQMAKTDMRATYAAYNNVLKNPEATPEAKSKASAAIEQANALMTASAALQASTGFLSGIGDGMGDGAYGTTNPDDLNVNQKILNTVDNFIKITLGLGVTPGANKAYQNMYYMAGAKVDGSPLFSKDFDSDGFALCQEYGNNAAAGMIAGVGELATGVALLFNPSTAGMALNLVVDSITTFTNGLYGVQKDARKAEKYTQEVLGYFKEAQSIAADTGNEEALEAISNGIEQISQTENFELKSDEVGDLDNWLEGSGSNTATNEKFNQSLTYDEWLKLIEADPTMRDYAKKLIAEKKER